MLSMLEKVLQHNGLAAVFAPVDIVTGLSMRMSKKLTFGCVHGSAIATMIGLVLAYWGGMQTGGECGLADPELFSGIGLMGGAMLCDFAIVATVFEAQVTEACKTGMIGAVSLLLETVLPFIVGVCVAYAFGHTDPVSVATIGTGAVMYTIGPVTGATLGAASDVMALSIATGLVKAIPAMVGTPLVAKALGLNNPRVAMVFGGLAGMISGVSAGLAATDRRLVSYGLLVATFHIDLGCLLGLSILFLVIQALLR